MATTPITTLTSTAAKASGMKNLAALDVLRRDIAKVNVVDTDFVVHMKSGRKILIRDGALRSATEDDFKVVFSDNEVVSGKEFFSQAQTLPAGNLETNWADAAITDSPTAEVSTAGLVAPITASSSSLTTIGLVGGLLAAAGGGGGGGGGDNNAAQIAALKTIADFARENTISMPTPKGNFQYKAGIPLPTVATYTQAKVSDVTDSNLAAINDALATANVTDSSVNTADKVQAVITAYNLIISLANGIANNNVQPTYADFSLIGVTGLDASTTSATKLLSSVIDLKKYADIDTINEIQALAHIAKRVIAAAAGNTTLTASELESLGLKLIGVNDFTKIIKAINDTNDDGSGVENLKDLQNLIDVVVGTATSALQTIVDFAQANTVSAPTQPVVGILVPVTTTYKTAGVSGVNDSNVASINDALMTAIIKGDSVNTLAKLQSLIDAYNGVLNLADGIGNNATPSLTLSVSQLAMIGADTTDLANANPSNRIDLLKSIIDGQKTSSVDTIKEINALITIANAIQDTAQGITTKHTLTANDLISAGISGVTDMNLDDFIKAIQDAKTDNVNNLSKLQNLLYQNLTISFTSITQDTGFDNRDFITTDTVLELNGSSSAADGTNIRITLMQKNQTDILLNGMVNNGKWSVGNTNNESQLLINGIYSLKAELLDKFGSSVRSQAFAQTITIDTSADQLPDGSPDNALTGKNIAFTGISPDTGVANDFVTNSTRLKFSGTSTANAGTHVGLNVDGVLLSNPSLNWINTGTGVNTWEIDYTGQDLSAGTHTIEVFLMDVAGNKLEGSGNKHDVLIDTAGLTLISKTTGAIAASANLVLTFSTAVKAVEGKYIYLTDESNTGAVIQVALTDTQQVSISHGLSGGFGTTVTIDLSQNLDIGHNYHATIDSGAFVTSAGILYEGLPYNQSANDWRFQAVDPSTTVVISGPNIDISNGLSADELQVVTISGTISGANLLSVTDVKISKLIFRASDGSSFEVTQVLPDFIDLTGSKTWTLANNSNWTSNLRTGKTYTVQAQLDSKVSNLAQTSFASSAAVAIDKEAPQLIGIVCDDNQKTSFKSGDSALFTLTFSEDPGNSLQSDELVVASSGGNAVGTITALYGTGNTRKVLFTAAKNINFDPTDTSPLFKIASNSFTDAAGNLGTIATGVATPHLRIDTQAPVINSITIIGIQKNGQEISTGTLIEGEKIRVIVQMSEITAIVGLPTFDINVGSAVKQANYVMRSGNNLIFEYAITLGDADSVGGITAGEKGLLTTSSRISDLVGNEANLSIATATITSNSLNVVTTGANDALTRIINFARTNTDPNKIQGTPPSVDDYAQAGIKNVNESNVNAINNSLATAVIDGTGFGDIQPLQNLVSAYNQILALANGKDDLFDNRTPNYLQYGLIGVQGVDSLQASLLSDVIDLKNKEDVDTISEVQDLANAAAAVLNLTKGVNGLTANQLVQKLGINRVTDDNFAAVSRAIANSSPTGSDVDSLEKLQSVVNTAVDKFVAALNALQTFANANDKSLSGSTTNYLGIKPTWSTLTDVGIESIPGVVDNKLADMVADALATDAVKAANVSTSALVQGVVSAYGAIALLANSLGDKPLNEQPKAVTYKLIGVSGFEDPSTAANIQKAKLLSDVIDRKALTDIDTVLEIQALADATSAVLANAANNGTVSLTQLKLLGFEVTAENYSDVTTAITDSPNDGSKVDTFLALSGVINSKLKAVDLAVALIASFADQNTVSQPTPSGKYQGTAPTAQTYLDAGVIGPVTDKETQAFNDALATSQITYSRVDSAQEIKDFVAAYRAVFKLADDARTTGGIQPTALQYHLIGISGFDPTDVVAATDSANRTSLIGDVIDRKVTDDVNTVLEIQAIANSVAQVMNMAKGVDGLSLDALKIIGITNVTADNLVAIKQAIDATPNDGTGVNTLVNLQKVVTDKALRFNESLNVIQQYAKMHDDPSRMGTDQPTVQHYLDLGLQSVTATNLEAINSALATLSVTDVQVSSANDVSNIVNAYADIFKAANNTYNSGTTVNPNDFALLGITGVGSSAVKLKLLSDVIDRQSVDGVNTSVKLQALADKVTALMNTAAKAATGGITQAQQLLDIGLLNVTAVNLNQVIAEIQKTNIDGTGVDTIEELQTIVNNVLGTQTTAMNLLVNFANENTASKLLSGAFSYKTGVPVPTEKNYMDAGISGIVSPIEAAAFNDALATNVITGSTISDISKLQVVVDAYRKVLALADGLTSTTPSSSLQLIDLQRLGADTTVLDRQTGQPLDARLRLLTDSVDRKNNTDVDTIAELNQLITIANAIQDLASGTTPSYALQATDFATFGIEGVGQPNLQDYLNNIKTAGSADSDSLNDLQNVLNRTLRIDFRAISEDRGVSATDFITSDNTLTYSGTSNAANGTAVKLILRKTTGIIVELNGIVTEGVWQIADNVAREDGNYTVEVQLLNSQQAVTQTTAQKNVSIDTSFNKNPDGSDDFSLSSQTIEFNLSSDTDSGTQGDYKTSNTRLKFIGTSNAVNGTHVALSVGGLVTYTTVQDGTWNVDYTGTPLDPKVHIVIASLVDASGNQASSGTSTVRHDVNIDSSVLTLSNKTSGAMASIAPLFLTFSDVVTAQAGKYIKIIDDSNNNEIDKIAVTDTTRVTITGSQVRVNTINGLTPGQNFHATLDAGAFVSSTGASSSGLTFNDDWRLTPADPTTSVNFGGTDVDISNGINAIEISKLSVSGTITSSIISALSNLKITKLTFTSTNGGTTFDITEVNNLPTVNGYFWILAPNTNWQSKLTSGKNYTVTAQVEGDIGAIHTSKIISSANILIDTEAPQLIITGNKTLVKVGESITYTFTFTDVPVGFDSTDIVVASVSNTTLGTLSNFTVTTDPKVFTVVFTPTVVVNQLSVSPISVLANSYTDSTGNPGRTLAAAPVVLIDTLAPGNISFNTIQGATQRSDAAFFNKIDTNNALGKVIAPNINKPTDADISIITLVVGGADLTFDSLLFGSITQALNTSNNGSNITIGDVTGISWNYNASTGNLTLQKTLNGALTADNVFAIERDLRFKTNSSPSQTPRTFTFTHTDAVGNVSGAGTQTLNVDTLAPQDVGLTSISTSIDKSLTRSFAAKDIVSGLFIVPDVAAARTAETDIASIRITMGGDIDSKTDSIALVGKTFFLIKTPQSSSNVAIDNVRGSVEFVFDTNNMLTISKTGGGSFNTSEVVVIEKLLQFKTSSTSVADRTATFTHSDQADNRSADSVVTLKVDTVAPSSLDIDGSTPVIDTVNNVTYKLQQPVTTTLYSFALTPKIAQPVDTDITGIQLVGTNLQAETDAIFIFADTFLFSASYTNKISTASGINVLVSQSNGTMVFTKTGGGAFLPAEVQTVAKTLAFGMASAAFQTTTKQGERSFAISYLDSFGNASQSVTANVLVDTLIPLDVDLRSDQSRTQVTDLSYFNRSNLIAGSKVIAPNIALTTDSDIRTINFQPNVNTPITFQFILGSFQLPLQFTATTSGTTVYNNLSLVWSYSNRTLSLRKESGGVFAAAEILSIEQGMNFSPNGTTPPQESYDFLISHTDAVGNIGKSSIQTITIDTVAPVVNIANTLTITNNSGSTAILLKSNAVVTESNTIQNVQIKAKNLRDGSNEKLIISNTELDASGATATSGIVLLPGANWNWTYNAMGVFTFALSSGLASATTAAALLQSISYRNAIGSLATDDARQFFVTTTDVAGNISAESVATVVIDARIPSIANPNPIVMLDANNDVIKGDQFVISFSESVKVTSITNTASWIFSSGNWGNNPSITAIDTITVNGTEYATNFWVKPGVGYTFSHGQNALVLTGGNITTAPYISIPQIAFGGDLTMEAWVNFTEITNFARIFDFGNNTIPIGSASGAFPVNNIWLGLNTSTTIIEFEAYSSNNMIGRIYSTSSISIKKWTHIAVTVDSNLTMTMYINGIAGTSVFQALSTAVPNVSRNSNYIGKSNWRDDGAFTGSIYDARVYDDARTANEIGSDFRGQIDLNDPQLRLAYSFDKTYVNSNSALGSSIPVNSPIFSSTLVNSSSMSILGGNVIDTNNSTSNFNQTFSLSRTNGSTLSGTRGNETLQGDTNNNFIAGQGGNDTLTGGAGADTFAWLLGETGSDRVVDFKVSEGDMINLSGLLQNADLGPSSLSSDLNKYMQLAQSGNDAVLTVDPTGNSNFQAANTSLKTITFTNGWTTGGLNDTLLKLVTSKVINLNYQNATPLMLDLNDDGVHTTSVDQGVPFDIEGNGQVVQTAWSDGKDGFLTLDVNGDGRINSGRELFGNGTLLSNGSKARDGFEALAQYDNNQDGVINVNDSVFANLRVWVDANHDGVSSASELYTLNALGVQNIQLGAKASQLIDNGNPFPLVSHWTDTAGHQHALADVLLTTSTQFKHDVVI